MTTPYDNPSTITDLLASSKIKYTLGQARLRRDQRELALLSFHGALEDALRAHLLRWRSPAATEAWAGMLGALRDDLEAPLAPRDIERVQQLHELRMRIARGEQVTVTSETVGEYHQLCASLLPRYQVLVVAADDIVPLDAARGVSARRARLPDAPQPDLEREELRFERWRSMLTPLLIVVSIFLIGASISIGLQQIRSGALQSSPTLVVLTPGTAQATTNNPITTIQPAPTLPVATVPGAPVATSVEAQPTTTVVAPNELAIGRIAYVRAEVQGGLNLRDQPSTTANIVAVLSPNSQAGPIVNGPVEAENFIWWQVSVGNEQGWCVGEFLEVR
ncbi:SH3 domain-containing protein [Candidatus Gracilibacteria bacterium]|nr:SH3 domain-containing protein [Candidatus Gracilibacteria bacterium]